jgi:hypothetical protein
MRLIVPVALVALIVLLAAAGESRAAKPASAPASAPSERAITWLKQEVALPAGGGVVKVLEIDDPKITQTNYAIRGRVKYKDVKGHGYLEMWNHFPDGTAYFSRTLDTSGPMGELHGESDWREFVLPFYSKPGKLPSKLEVNVVLPEGGTVQLGEAKLVQPFANPSADAGAGAGGAWWDDRQGAKIGAIMGTSLGIMGALIGILAGIGRSRRLVLSLAMTAVTFSVTLLLLGVVALAAKQPYAVWYPLVLGGGIGTIVVGSLIPMIKRRYAEHELRRMTAADVMA